ncbi:MBOAT family O-acyltransferase [Nostoc sp. CMAA1605]|uniref:MBOAT family O-acyltransferase n=1 Tax=Nostoc sp. CMAA1605 TaxID=2055159 RepID=UPI001F353DC2|nr:MBOAT family O-acyltransferase [Nostoc sp. CMAA1605]
MNLSYLGFFKYYNFFIDSLQEIFNILKISSDIQILSVLVPVGISFYTFRIISHLIDSYKNQLPCPKFLDYLVYITYFPQIASGPIARAKEFYQQLNSDQKYNYQTERVVILIISGLFKKYTLSSFLFNFTQSPFQIPEQYSSFDLILAALAYSCYIYVDFSGYSDLANAISSLLGFPPVPNFNMPYCAQSLQDFWRRWHISLSQWLRDYLYISLGGSRKGYWRKYFNLLMTMVIGGFWHGAGLNFLIWGFLHGIGLVVTHLWQDLIKNFKKQKQSHQDSLNHHIIVASKISHRQVFIGWLRFYFQRITSILRPTFACILTFSYVTLCWIFFNTSNWETSLKFLQQMVNTSSNIEVRSQFNVWQLYITFIIIFIMNFYGDKFSGYLQNILSKSNLIIQTILISTLLYTVFRLGPNTVPPFVYFGF